MNAKQRLNRLKNYETDVETLNNELIALKPLVLKGQVLSHDTIRTNIKVFLYSWLFKGKNSTNARPFSEHYQPC